MKKLLQLKTMLLLCALIAGSGSVWAAEEVYYTLEPATGTNNSYAGNCDVTINGITWNITGNSQQIPWRIGGKSLSNVDRVVYSKTAMGSAISKVELEVGAASSITVNSLKLIVASDAAFNNQLDEVSQTFAANSTITFTPTSGTDWPTGAYYKFIFNVTVSGSSNKFVEFTSAEFYQTVKSLKSISLSGSYPTTFDVGDAFSHDGMTVTAVYEDNSEEDVSSQVTFSGYDMSTAGTQEVTVSYTKNAVTKTATYDIIVSNVAVTGVSLKSSTVIEKEKTETLTPTFAPLNATNKNVSWESDDTSVATVDKDGVVTAVALGEANITVTTEDGGYTATCVVTVVNQKGSKEYPYTVAEVLNNDASGKTNVWVKGYIVGSWKDNKFDPSNLVDSNLALADEYNSNTTMPVELTDASGLRANWGPASNKHLVGVAHVLLKGNGIDYFKIHAIKGASEIEKIGEMLTITDAKYATYCTDEALDFSEVAVKPYKAKVEGTAVKLTQLDDVLPAENGVVLYCETPGAYYVPVTTSSAIITENEMVGVLTDTTINYDTDPKYNYILQNDGNNNAVFNKAAGAKLRGHRAYLSTSYDVTAASARGLEIVFDNDVTGINTVSTSGLAVEEYYNLAGQRVAQPSKGLYIVNGRKVIVK